MIASLQRQIASLEGVPNTLRRELAESIGEPAPAAAARTGTAAAAQAAPGTTAAKRKAASTTPPRQQRAARRQPRLPGRPPAGS